MTVTVLCCTCVHGVSAIVEVTAGWHMGVAHGCGNSGVQWEVGSGWVVTSIKFRPVTLVMEV